jgi:putative restriction endonuclease
MLRFAHRRSTLHDPELRFSLCTTSQLTQNRWLREAAELQIPVIYFVGIKPGLYQPAFPAFVTDWDPSRLNVRIVFTPALGATNKAAFPADSEDRRYAMRLVKQRLHQAQFREAVIDAHAA